MRADRLVSLVLLLRQQGKMSALQLARELEVSTRTVLRDIEALCMAGIPVYAQRGRNGGFAILPGLRTELTGLNHDEALALITAGAASAQRVLGLGTSLASATRKVIDALPEGHRATLAAAAQRLLVEPHLDLLSRPAPREELAPGVLDEVRAAVLRGTRLRFRYRAPERPPAWRTVDPIGLVTARGRTYLLATTSGEERSYRVSRMLAAEALAEPAIRAPEVDLDRVWAARAARFLSGGHLTALVRVDPRDRDELLDMARAVRAERLEPDGRVHLEVVFDDLRHAVWAIWRLRMSSEVLAPAELRAAIAERAAALTERYRHPAV